METTLSFRMDSCYNEMHNMRMIYVPYADKAREKDNICFMSMTKREAYDYLFADAVAEYNEEQKRKDRKIIDYLQKIQDKELEQKKRQSELRASGASYKKIAKHRKQKQSGYEIIVALGNCKQNPEFCPGGEREEDVKAILTEYVTGFQERNPNAFLYNANLHADEQGAIHLHADVVFYGNYDSGLKKRVSLKKALEEMGFGKDKEQEGRKQLPVTSWQNREREIIKEICKKYDIDIVNGNQSRQHLNREQYIIQQEKERINEKNASIANAVSQINEFITTHELGKPFYYSVKLKKKENELDSIKREYEAMKRKYEIIAEQMQEERW